MRLPAPVRVAYEAGPTGYGLARACAAAGIGCMVAAPSKIPRASGDKVKTDRRDAERLARLLRLGELVPVRVPEPHEEQARDLVRAREDARGELMRARHRLSKLLLRHGSSTTRAPGRSLTTSGCAGSGSRAALRDRVRGVVRRRPAGEDSPRCARRGDRRGRSRATLRRDRRQARCLRGVATLTALALTLEIGDWTRFRAHRWVLPGPDPERVLERRAAPGWERSPRPGTRMRGGCWSRPPGTSAGRCARAPRSRSAERRSRPRCRRGPTRAPADCTAAGTRSSAGASAAPCSPSPSRASWPDTAGRWRPCSP